jgi:hypothetical protein
MFEVPAEFQEKLKNAMKDENGIKLPFAAPTMWWMNGNIALKNLKQIEDATRFGGWGISKEDIDGFGSDLAEIPATWVLHEELTNRDNGTYAAYLCRSAWVAPIARRYGWFERDGKSRSKVNVLCYLAIYQPDRTLLPYGPVVLSASSYTGSDLDKCFKDFAAKSAQLRGSTSPNFFYHPIGTWGKEPIYAERKAKTGGSSSSVTPPQLYLPKDGLSLETLKAWFVGPDIAAEMATYLDQAQEWLADWKRKDEKKAQEPNPFDTTPAPPEDDGFPY